MQNLYNLALPTEQVSFREATLAGLGQHQGLFFRQQWPAITAIDELLSLNFVERSTMLLTQLIDDSTIPVSEMVEQSFTFPALLKSVTSQVYCLELFHGPTLAFKDFGARFMAQCLQHFANKTKITILTATSGDTGAAVADAFYGLDNVDVVILYPKNKVSPIQECLFTTLGKNIYPLAIETDFDGCQALVKQALQDQVLTQKISLNSANSINISRLYAQVCYYFEALSQLDPFERHSVQIAVPSGNFGNVTAGLIAHKMGLPIHSLIAATNHNDTVPRFIHSQQWQPKATQPSMSNAMDVSQPNNWPRTQQLIAPEHFSTLAVNEKNTQIAMKILYQFGYLSEPHAAVAYWGLKQFLTAETTGIFLGTAHPAKFAHTVKNILQHSITLPESLTTALAKPNLAQTMPADYQTLTTFLLDLP